MELKHRQIIDLFTSPEEAMHNGLWMSGIHGEGEHKEWHISGKLSKHSFWKNGKLEGEYKDFWDTGKLCQHCFWKNGKLEGEFKEWSFGGTLVYSRNYKNGVEV